MAHIEREIKLSLPPRDFARLAKLARERRSLASVYYDTARQELRRAGVALRLRRDGGRWLQTLKSEAAPRAGLAERAEWELPVRRKALEPRAFPRGEIRDLTGIDLEQLAPRLKPVFETRFTRRSGLLPVGGTAKAVLAIDRGRILAGGRHEPINEVELELISGDAASLLRFAEALELPLAYESKAERGYRLAQGGAPAPRTWRMPVLEPTGAAGEAFARLFATALTQIGVNATRMPASRDPEYLHQLRVGLRRLRCALQAFAPLLHNEKPIRRALRRASLALGGARDWDVFIPMMERARASPRVLRAARSRRSAERRSAAAVVSASRFRTFLFQAMRWLERRPWGDAPVALGDFAPQRLEKAYRRALRRVELRRAGPRHKLRVRLKRLRYTCEFFAPCYAPEVVEPYVSALRTLQDVLGELNDIAVARRLLKEIDAPAPRALRAREDRLSAALRKAWSAFEKTPPYWRPAE